MPITSVGPRLSSTWRPSIVWLCLASGGLFCSAATTRRQLKNLGMKGDWLFARGGGGGATAASVADHVGICTAQHHLCLNYFFLQNHVTGKSHMCVVSQKTLIMTCSEQGKRVCVERREYS